MKNSEKEQWGSFMEKLNGATPVYQNAKEKSQDFFTASVKEELPAFPFNFMQEGTVSVMIHLFNEDIKVETDKSVLNGDFKNITQSNKHAIAFLNTSSTIRVNSIQNLQFFIDLTYHKCPVYDIRKCHANPNLFASVDIDGNLFVWKLEPLEEGFTVIPLLQSKMKEGRKTLVWKNELELAAFNGNEIEFWTISEEEANSSEQMIPPPFSYRCSDYPANILDFDFSKKNNLYYVSFEDSSLGIYNPETPVKIREFVPFKGQKCVKVFAYKDIFQERQVSGLNDVFITVSENFHAKVWDLNQWDSEAKEYKCLQDFDMLTSKSKNCSLADLQKIQIIWSEKMELMIVWKTLNNQKTFLSIFHISSEFSEGNKAIKSIESKFFESQKEIGLFSDSTFFGLDFISFPGLQAEIYFQTEFKKSLIPESLISQCSAPVTLSIFGMNANSIRTYIISKENAISGDKNDKLSFQFSPKIKVNKDLIKKPVSRDEMQVPAGGTTENNAVLSDTMENVSKAIPSKKVFYEEQKNEQGSQKPKILPRKIKPKVDDSASKEEKNFQFSQGTQKATKPVELPESMTLEGLKMTKKEEKETSKPFQLSETKVEPQSIPSELQTSSGIEALFEKLEKKFISRFDRIESKLLQTQSNIKAQKTDIPVSLSNLISDSSFQSVLKKEIEATVKKEIESSIKKEFATQFETQVTPCIEKYMVVLSEQVSSMYEKGHKYFLEKINAEQIKSIQIKESLKETLNLFTRVSHLLQENIIANQRGLLQVNNFLTEKSNQFAMLTEQMKEIQEMEYSLIKKIEEVNRCCQEILNKKMNESVEGERKEKPEGIESFGRQMQESSENLGPNVDNNLLLQQILNQNNANSLSQLLRAMSLREYCHDYGNMVGEEFENNFGMNSNFSRHSQGSGNLHAANVQRQIPRSANTSFQYPPNLPHPHSYHQQNQSQNLFPHQQNLINNPNFFPNNVQPPPSSSNENIINQLNSSNLQTMMQLLIQNWKDLQTKEGASNKSSSSRLNEGTE